MERTGAATDPAVRARRLVLATILVIAAAVRLLAWQSAVLMTNDGPDFLWQAERFRAGDFAAALGHPYHPLYGAAVAALSLATGGTLAAAVAISIASGLALVLAVGSLAQRAFPRLPGAAPLAALLAAVQAHVVIETSDVQSDALFAALFLTATACLLAAFDRGACRRRMLLAGVLAGLAYLTRPEGLALLAVAALALAAGWACSRGGRHAAAAGVFLAALAVVGGPYVVAMHALTGHWGVSLKPSVGAAGLANARASQPPPADSPLGSPRVDRIRGAAAGGARGALGSAPGADAQDETSSRGATATAPSEAAPSDATPPDSAPPDAAPPDAAPPNGKPPGAPAGVPRQASLRPWIAAVDEPASGGSSAAARRRPLGTAADVLLVTLRLDVLALVVVGLLVLRRERSGLCLAAIAIVAGWVAMGALNIASNHYLSARHMLVPALLLLPAAGAGAAALAALAGRQRALGLAMPALFALVLVANTASALKPRHAGSEPRLAALAWASAHSAPGERVGVHRSRDAFYAGRPVLQVELPCHEQALLAAMQQWGVTWLVLDEPRVRRAAPQWLQPGAFVTRARFGEGEDAVVVLARAPPAD